MSINPQSDAIEALMLIKMKDAENTDVYIARFKMLMEIAVITNENIAKRLYKKGLIPALQK